MAKEIKTVGPVVRAKTTLHGKVVKLMRGGKEVVGTLLSKDRQGPSDNLAFQWKDINGNSCINEVTKDELDLLRNPKVKVEKIVVKKVKAKKTKK